jgi:hypothetical protein
VCVCSSFCIRTVCIMRRDHVTGLLVGLRVVLQHGVYLALFSLHECSLSQSWFRGRNQPPSCAIGQVPFRSRILGRAGSLPLSHLIPSTPASLRTPASSRDEKSLIRGKGFRFLSQSRPQSGLGSWAGLGGKHRTVYVPCGGRRSPESESAYGGHSK